MRSHRSGRFTTDTFGHLSTHRSEASAHSGAHEQHRAMAPASFHETSGCGVTRRPHVCAREHPAPVTLSRRGTPSGAGVLAKRTGLRGQPAALSAVKGAWRCSARAGSGEAGDRRPTVLRHAADLWLCRPVLFARENTQTTSAGPYLSPSRP